MIGKFASVLWLLVLIVGAGSQAFAQTAPADQAPSAPPVDQAPAAQTPAQPAAQIPAQTGTPQPASAQEPAEEESTSRRKKVHTYKLWNYNVGVGANVDG